MNMEEQVNEQIGVKDELGQEILDEQIKNLKTEIDLFKKNIEQVEKSKKNYEDQWIIDKELFALKHAEFEPLESALKFKFELNPRYWELVKQKQAYEIRHHTHMAEGQIEGYNKQLEALQEQLDSANTELEKLEADKNE